MNRTKSVLMYVLAAFVLTACGGTEASTGVDSIRSGVGAEATPVVTASSTLQNEHLAAYEWILGLVTLDGNKILKYTCLNQREKVKDTSVWLTAFSTLGTGLAGREIKGDVSDLRFETAKLADNYAELHVFGELRIAVGATADAYQLDETWYMILENETWRWCGSDSGELPLIAAPGPIDSMEQSDGGHIPENEFTTKQWIVYSNGLDIFRISPDGTGQINLTAHDCACRNYSPAVYGQMIAFSRENPDGRGNTALYIMDMNGDNQRDLIPDLLTYLITNILWSPNGQRLLFAAMASDGTDKLYSVSITGDIAELAIQPYVRAWSPDSQNIFLVKIADSNWDIYLLNAAGGNQINLSNHPDRDYDPSGAPDGNKVVFASNRTGNYDIHVVSVDGNNLINLTKSPADDSHPMWSPVDNKIAFVSKQGELFDLYLMNSNGDDLHRLTNTGYSLIVKTVWSPDGRSIAFVAYQADSSRYSLLVISLQRSSLTTLVDSWNSDLYNPIWADDGGSIAFVSAGQLFVVNADGSGLLKLADEVQDDSISWAR